MYSRTNYELAEFAEEAISAFIMALSVLNSIYLSSVSEGMANFNVAVLSVFGANLAWGIIDGVVQYVGIQVRRARFKRLSRSLRASMSLEQFISHLQINIDEDIVHSWGADAVQMLFAKKDALPTQKISATYQDVFAFFGVLLVYALAAAFVTAPLFIIPNLYHALIVANALSTLGLFAIGYGWGKSIEQVSPMKLGFLTAFVGFMLLAVCILLGG